MQPFYYTFWSILAPKHLTIWICLIVPLSVLITSRHPIFNRFAAVPESINLVLAAFKAIQFALT